MMRAFPTLADQDRAERLSSLFDAHSDRLYRLARRLAPSADDALDLVQETFLRAARSSPSVPCGNPSEEAWLVRVLVNIRRDQWRKEAVRKLHDMAVNGNLRNPESALITKADIWRALDVLPPRRRAVLVMHELEGLPVPAIAEMLGISTITVRWHLSIAKRELRRVLKSYLGGTDAADD